MPKNTESISPKHSTAATSVPYPYSHLTKAEIVKLFGRSVPLSALSHHELTRCAIAIISRWCDDVIHGRYASTFEIKRQLDLLDKIYNGNR